MKPHIVTEDMRLRAGDGQELEGKLSAPGWRRSRLVVQVNGSGPQTCNNTFRDRGDGDHSSGGFFLGGACRPGTGLLLLQHPRVHRWGSGSTLLPRVDRAVYRSPPLRPVWPTWLDSICLFRPTPCCVLGRSSCCWGGARGTMIARLWLQGGSGTPIGLLLAGLRQRTMEEALDRQSCGAGLYTMLILTPTEMGASPGREFERGGERCEALRRPLRLDRTGTAGSPRRTWRRWRRSRAGDLPPSRRGRRVALGTLPSPLTTNWFRGHRRFPQPGDPALDLPIHIPPGRWDANTPAEDALAIQETFRRLGKDNLPSTSTLTQDTPWALSSIWPLRTAPPPSLISLSCARGWDDRTGAGERASQNPAFFRLRGPEEEPRLKGKALVPSCPVCYNRNRKSRIRVRSRKGVHYGRDLDPIGGAGGAAPSWWSLGKLSLVLAVVALAVACLALYRTLPPGRMTHRSQGERAESPTISYRDREPPVLEGVAVNSYVSDGFSVNDRGWLTYEQDGKQAAIGIDVSAYQGEIDWQQVADSGVEFAMIRLGYRGYSQGVIMPDKNFEQNLRGRWTLAWRWGSTFSPRPSASGRRRRRRSTSWTPFRGTM